MLARVPDVPAQQVPPPPDDTSVRSDQQQQQHDEIPVGWKQFLIKIIMLQVPTVIGSSSSSK